MPGRSSPEPLFLDEPPEVRGKSTAEADGRIAEWFADESGPNPWDSLHKRSIHAVQAGGVDVSRASSDPTLFDGHPDPPRIGPRPATYRHVRISTIIAVIVAAAALGFSIITALLE